MTSKAVGAVSCGFGAHAAAATSREARRKNFANFIFKTDYHGKDKKISPPVSLSVLNYHRF
jgi:hypothetical protein